MPYSLVLNLIPHSAIPKSNLSGRHLHALFLELVNSVDADLASALHQQQSQKAFTLSPLQASGVKSQGSGKSKSAHIYQPSPITHQLQFQHDCAIPANTPCWWRISLLDESLFGKLSHLWLNLNPTKPWHFGAVDLQVTSILGTPQPTQPWANFSTYAQLYEQASDGVSGDRPQDARQIRFLLCTPTTFKRIQYDCALPMPEFVFQSLLKRWNQYSNIGFPEAIIQHIYPSFFDIRTEIAIDSRSKLIGCVGAVTFQILGDVDPLTIKQINTLADFALYAGVGKKTPMGMGMIRRV